MIARKFFSPSSYVFVSYVLLVGGLGILLALLYHPIVCKLSYSGVAGGLGVC